MATSLLSSTLHTVQWYPKICTTFRHLICSSGSFLIASFAYQKRPRRARCIHNFGLYPSKVAAKDYVNWQYVRVSRGTRTPQKQPNIRSTTQNCSGSQSAALTTELYCPEGHFGGNQLLDGSMGLAPLCSGPTGDLHVSGAYGPPPGFPPASPCLSIVHRLSGTQRWTSLSSTLLWKTEADRFTKRERAAPGP